MALNDLWLSHQALPLAASSPRRQRGVERRAGAGRHPAADDGDRGAGAGDGGDWHAERELRAGGVLRLAVNGLQAHCGRTPFANNTNGMPRVTVTTTTPASADSDEGT